MAGAATGDDGDLGSILGRTAVDDFVVGVKGERRVGEGDGLESGVDQVGWVVDEVFGSRHRDMCFGVFLWFQLGCE